MSETRNEHGRLMLKWWTFAFSECASIARFIVVLVLAPSTLERWQVASHAAIWGFLKGIPVLSSNRWDFMKLEVNKKLEQYCLRVRIDEEQI